MDEDEYIQLPTFATPLCEYTPHNAVFHGDHASLSTVGDVPKYGFPDEVHDTLRLGCLRSEEWETSGGTLHYYRGVFYLYVRTKAGMDDPDPAENGTVLCVGLDVEHITVTSTGVFRSVSDFTDGRGMLSSEIRTKNVGAVSTRERSSGRMQRNGVVRTVSSSSGERMYP